MRRRLGRPAAWRPAARCALSPTVGNAGAARKHPRRAEARYRTRNAQGARMYVAVEGIVETLRGVPPPRFQPGHICALLHDLTIRPETLQPFLHFAPRRYTRNLIYCVDLQQGEDAIHRVSNPSDERAVSLHVYSRPYDLCLAYDLEAQTSREMRLIYHSAGGRIFQPERRQ